MQKVVLSAKIKKCEIVEGKLEFDKLNLTSNECKQIKIWADGGDHLQIVLELLQGELFGEDTKGESIEERQEGEDVAA